MAVRAWLGRGRFYHRTPNCDDNWLARLGLAWYIMDYPWKGS